MADRITDLIFAIPQQELARHVGVDDTYLSKVLNGKREPSPFLLAGLHRDLNERRGVGTPGITVDELVEWLDLRFEYDQVAP